MTPEQWEEAARKAMAMYDWSKAETRAINDFILTVRDAASELLSAMPVEVSANEPLVSFSDATALSFEIVDRALRTFGLYLTSDKHPDREAMARVLQEFRASLAASGEATVTLSPARFTLVENWLDGIETGTARSDDALVKITDAKGAPICTVTAGWLRSIPCEDEGPRQPETYNPGGVK